MSPSSVDNRRKTTPPSEAQETVEAIHQGSVDAIVVQGPQGPRVVMLQSAEGPYRVLVERMSDGALTLGPEGTILYVNTRLAELTGRPPERLVGRNFGTLFAGAQPTVAHNVAREAKLRRSSGEPLPVSVWTSPISIEGIPATLVTITDLSMHRRAQEIANAERFARSILEQATDAIVVLAPNGQITHASWMAEQIAAVPPVGNPFSVAFPIATQGATQAATLMSFARESLDTDLAAKPFHGVEVQLRISRLNKRSFLLSAGPLLNDAKQSVGSIVTLTDITDRKRAEEKQTILVAELNHRVKNILAIVQSVASQTLRSSSSLPSFNATFAGRIKALSIAHDILTQTRWIGIGLNELLAAVLAPYRTSDQTRLTLDGPPVLLPARAVLPLSMALHELATNASKYGALSGARGAVQVSWILFDSDPSAVRLTWQEQGGPVVDERKPSGFGTRLIERVVTYDLDGTVDLSFAAEGIRAIIAFPLVSDTASTDVPGSAAQLD